MNQPEFSTACSLAADAIEVSSEIYDSFEDNNVSSLLKVYYSMNYQFKMFGRPELTERMLRRIMMSSSISRDFQMKPLYVNLSGIIDELMMNEIEMALWAIYLEDIVWKDFGNFSEQVILFSAYEAKLYLNGNSIIPIKVYLMAKIEDFQKNFNLWHNQYEVKLEIDPRSINSKLSELKKFKGAEIDYGALSYNYYVDVILLTAVPYAARKGKRVTKVQEELTEEKKNSKCCELTKSSMKEKVPKPRKIQKIEQNDNIEAPHECTKLEKHDSEIEKIEKYCDGLIENDDIDPDDFLISY